jgi:hypothetical protein
MRSIRMWFAVAGILIFAAAASAQMGGRMAMPGFQGIWNPVVGTGALYAMQSEQGGTSQVQMAIVGQETVAGKTAYWFEFSSDRGGGTMYAKYLYVVDNGNMQILKMIIQPPGRGPMEMPVGGMGGGPMGNHQQPAPRTSENRRRIWAARASPCRRGRLRPSTTRRTTAPRSGSRPKFRRGAW